MVKKHNFLILNENFCTNKRAVVNFLMKIIHEEKSCIGCGDLSKEYKSGGDVQKHIRDKGCY